MKIIAWLWVLAAVAAYLIQFAPLVQLLIRRFIG
jgi:hypothetical protein